MSVYAKRYVYFARGQVSGLVKIGFSQCVRQRVKQLSTDERERVSVLAVMPQKCRGHELAIYKDFARMRVRGEWFRPGRRLLRYVADVRRKYPRLSGAK